MYMLLWELGSSGVAIGAERFKAREEVTRIRPSVIAEKMSTNGYRINLKVSEIQEVLRHQKKTRQTELAFYLPIEGTSVAQVIIEEKGKTVTYFLKGLNPGKAVGGVVERSWLNKDGFAPNNPADEARLQKAVKLAPYLITVEAAAGQTK